MYGKLVKIHIGSGYGSETNCKVVSGSEKNHSGSTTLDRMAKNDGLGGF
jgi:hypothetical protein